MIRSIKITFPVKKKNRDDTYKTMAQYEELGDARCFILPETNRALIRKHHIVTEGCIIEDLITEETFRCINVNLTIGQSKYPILQVTPI